MIILTHSQEKSLNGLKNFWGWFSMPNVRTGQGPSVNWFLDCVFLTSLVIGCNFTLIIVWMMMLFFCIVSDEIIYWKIRFPGNIKFYPTLEQNLLCCEINHHRYPYIVYHRSNYMSSGHSRQSLPLVIT